MHVIHLQVFVVVLMLFCKEKALWVPMVEPQPNVAVFKKRKTPKQMLQ